MTHVDLDAFKENFHIYTDVKDINFRKIIASSYNSTLQTGHEFGEKKSLLYQVELTVFNVEVILKILAFKYESHVEALKLEIKISNSKLENEMISCRNFLQRKRNINLVFEVLIKFTELFEMRRLICTAVFQKRRNVVSVRENDGITVKCFSDDGRVLYLEFSWSLSWNVDTYEVGDVIEFCLKNSVFQPDQERRIKLFLGDLVKPKLNFQTKLRLWNFIMDELYGDAPRIGDNESVVVMTDVLEIEDSDSDDNDVIEIDQSLSSGTGHSTDEVMVID